VADQRFSVATFNANSLRVRLEQVLQWLDSTGVDVLCVQETKVQDADFPVQAITDAGYRVSFRGQKAHAGVAVLSREEIEQVSYGLADAPEPDEARLIAFRFADIHIINTYVPQGRTIDSEHYQYKLEWFRRLRSYLEQRFTPTDAVLWVGDLNVAPEPIDVHDPKALEDHVDFHIDARLALEQVVQWGFTDLFRLHHPDEPEQYTYWDYRARNPLENKIGWRIDHVMATAPLAARCERVWIDVEARRAERPSDHTFLVAEFRR